MILDRVGVASLAQAVLEVGAEVGKELLRERTGPSGDGGWVGGVERGNERPEILEDLHWCMERLLAVARVKARGGELTKLVKDGLGG